jgi:hypothetical protein
MARMGRSVRAASSSSLEITIPTMDWEQIGGDMDPGTYGGTIATADGRSIELIKIQPVREYVGDKEAAEVGFPFWTRESSFDIDDLDPNNRDVQRALDSIGMSLETLKEDFTPTQRAMVIAEALMDHGRADEGPSGWSGDIGIPDKVKWWSGKIAGPEYIADEDEEFLREVVLGDLDIDYESYGPDEKNPTSGLKVVTRGHTVEITEWTDIEDATGEEQPEGEKISKQYAEVELDELLDPKGKHRGAYSRDDRSITLPSLGPMDEEDREKAIVAAAIAYLAYFVGDEEFVDQIGD